MNETERKAIEQGDIPLACTRSGGVVLLDGVCGELGSKTNQKARLDLARNGLATRMVGRLCGACAFASADHRFCEYRPLRGPLFVPR